ncbi:Probable linoleate 9S-lipoxygenase 5 [Linum perenne]
MPNRPTTSRRLMPEVNIPANSTLWTHSSDEVYLAQREMEEWTADLAAIAAFKKFGKALAEVENRHGPVKIPYTLLFPSTEAGRTARGIPNSITI